MGPRSEMLGGTEISLIGGPASVHFKELKWYTNLIFQYSKENALT
jgi:hypothetical protein